MKRILDTEQLNIIGPRIKEARVRAGLSQKQLSEKLELMAVYTCRAVYIAARRAAGGAD